jgi:hypothetical protein
VPAGQYALLPLGLEDDVGKKRGEGRKLVVFPHDVIARSHDVEIEPPIDVVVVYLTNAIRGLINGSEPESRLERAVDMESPFRYVSVPACNQLGLENDFEAIDVVRNASEIAPVDVRGIEYRFWRGMAQSESWTEVSPRAAKGPFLPLPIPILGATTDRIILILHIQYGYMSSVEQRLAFVPDVSEFDS